jgi:hypothetical protein
MHDASGDRGGFSHANLPRIGAKLTSLTLPCSLLSVVRRHNHEQHWMLVDKKRSDISLVHMTNFSLVILLGAFSLSFSLNPAEGFVSTTRPSRRSAPRVCGKVKPDNSDDDNLIVEKLENPGRRELLTNIVAGGLLVASAVASSQFYQAAAYEPAGFRRIPTQFIAALGDPTASTGLGADEWGLWRLDPGPRGVWLRDYASLEKSGGVAPAGWRFDRNNWWVEEHGLIMEAPEFPLPAARYLVTGARSITTVLTVAANGQWSLDEGCLYDVTHLPCRSARYKPTPDANGSPLNARLTDFPVKPGSVMPVVSGTEKTDYAVLFLVGKEV